MPEKAANVSDAGVDSVRSFGCPRALTVTLAFQSGTRPDPPRFLGD
jgi:hypothetical protein